jgi:hypothetical protein
VTWDIEVTDEFEAWYHALDGAGQDRIDAVLALLEVSGPGLGRPKVGQIATSRHPNLKELISGDVRILFAFDPRQVAIVLLGGSKRGRWNAWYSGAVPRADDLYDVYLKELRDEGLL